MRRTVFNLREQLWLLAHDDRYTPLRPLVDVRALNVGLVAATVIDLLRADLIRIGAGTVYVAGQSQGLLGDPIGAALLAALDNEQAPLLVDLLRAACADRSGDVPNPFQDGYEHTRTALTVAGHLRVERRLLRSPCYHLVDPQLIAPIRNRLNHRLVYHERDDNADIDCLSALTLGVGLQHGLRTPFEPAEAERILWAVTDNIAHRAGPHSPLAAVPYLVHTVRNTIGDLATAPF